VTTSVHEHPAPVSTLSDVLADHARHLDASGLAADDLEAALAAFAASPVVEQLVIELIRTDVYSPVIAAEFSRSGAATVLADLRRLATVLTQPTASGVAMFARVLDHVAPDAAAVPVLADLARRLVGTEAGRQRMSTVFGTRPWVEAAELSDPHAVAATSPYRRSAGHVVASDDDRAVDAVMSQQTFTSLRVTDGVLRPENRLLADLYLPHERCVAFVDVNVVEHHGRELRAYFDHHGIELRVLAHRAMEVDKGIRTVETMLGELKALGVARNEPVLVVGGGVIADTAGLACALFHRSTPYVMLSTSLVAGIDAGPSPRTCCDGFGYKNLFGAYHPPILSITDRSFFASLRPGWLRHGMAEIAKMAIVDDLELFELLEQHGPDLVTTLFGNISGGGVDDLGDTANTVIGKALRSYVAAEYGNLYETHQLRPHAYGHTWSPGFEISAGLLHGHAVSIGMGFGAFLAQRAGLLDESEVDRIHTMLSSIGLALWHDVLDDHDLVWAAQERMVEKRGGRLFAPVPSGGIGRVGYLDAPTFDELRAAISDYRAIATSAPLGGRGIEPLCADVGLDDPSVVADTTPSISLVADPTDRSDSTPTKKASNS